MYFNLAKGLLTVLMSWTCVTPLLLLRRAVLQRCPGLPELAAALALLLPQPFIIYSVLCPLDLLFILLQEELDRGACVRLLVVLDSGDSCQGGHHIRLVTAVTLLH